MKWLSRVLFAGGIVSLVLFAGYLQFGREVEVASADVVTSPWPTSATTGTHLMVITMTTSTNWIAPSGVSSVIVEAWGAGGAARPTTADGCGGGGGYARSLVPVTPGTAYWIQVGWLEPNATSTFATTTVVAAPGWSWTNGAAPGAAASSTGDVKYSGDGNRGTGRGHSAGDLANAPTAFYGGNSNGVSGGTAIDKALRMPGGSACDIADKGAPGLVRLSYSSSSLSGFPYVRQRYWERTATVTGNPTVHAPTTTQVGDVLLAYVYADLFDPATIGDIRCYTNCGGWTMVFASSTAPQGTGGVALFKKEATSTLGNDFTVTTTKLYSSWSNYWSYVTLALGNADVSKFFYATSSAFASNYGNPPSLNTGVTDKYMWLHGAVEDSYIFCIQQYSTGTMTVPPLYSGASSLGIVWWEEFKEVSSFDPPPINEFSASVCTSAASPDPFSFTFAIAGLAASPGGSPVFLQRPQRIINIF